VKLTRKGGAIYVDNVVGEILESDAIDKENFLTKVGKFDGIQATLVQTLWGGIMDGALLAVVD
jgi:hypothetical protein